MLACHFNSLLLTLFNAVGTVEFSINACVQKGKLISFSLCIIGTIVKYVGRDFFLKTLLRKKGAGGSLPYFKANISDVITILHRVI